MANDIRGLFGEVAPNFSHVYFCCLGKPEAQTVANHLYVVQLQAVPQRVEVDPPINPLIISSREQ